MKDSLLIIGFGLILIAVLLYPSSRINYSSTTLHVVAPGETLWSIAEKYNPHKDPREVIRDMRAINEGLMSIVYAGQEIQVPVWDTK